MGWLKLSQVSCWLLVCVLFHIGSWGSSQFRQVYNSKMYDLKDWPFSQVPVVEPFAFCPESCDPLYLERLTQQSRKEIWARKNRGRNSKGYPFLEDCWRLSECYFWDKILHDRRGSLRIKYGNPRIRNFCLENVLVQEYWWNSRFSWTGRSYLRGRVPQMGQVNSSYLHSTHVTFSQIHVCDSVHALVQVCGHVWMVF